WPDLYVANGCGAVCNLNGFLFHNNGGTNFTQITTNIFGSLAGNARSGTWADYDNDGRPDLVVVNIANGGKYLLHNLGGGNFAQVSTAPLGTDGGNSHDGVWADYDRDGWLDLLVANFSGQNEVLYHNNRNGTFTSISAGAAPNVTSDGG